MISERKLVGLFFLFLGISCVLQAEEFTQPKSFSNFGSDLGDQQLVDVVKPWVGATPEEIAPGAVPLGSMQHKSIFIPEANRFLDREIGRDLPTSEPKILVDGWVGPFLNEIAPGAISLGSLSNRKSMPKRPRIKGPIEKAIIATAKVSPLSF